MAIRKMTLGSEAETVALAQAMAARARAGDAVLLSGNLGAGKSTFARAFIRARAGDASLDVPSPSFTLVQTYELDPPVTHFDLWRLTGPDDVAELGLDAALAGIALIEWPDRLGPLAPREAITLALGWGEGNTRTATASGPDALLERLMR
ncbi:MULTISPECIES: tRNA (adenosine(37)-N6)-threonylcarbamoyltransferase complex ATPase subunit type 1 TsaE [Acidiphilium]|uniref:tRNA (adenosine(37)-N6)-threonylcarbamoyltransferase complex ATPase subunit type 1 TsaE n=1 Tax=Acidiphilium TaxID=522 RepID=UPI000461609B|nr:MULTISPECIES: tRNA (adenosine(37)-N6)-threonylcarbamoyltransferase complex ATPase subunit type 1 TsaE [Acidiphilium]KDM66259.1 tRNA threonylcarbamoyl adenosine modification protein YjeE [Acidiphilium sp. JA12-A1]UNC15288.1 tRNA (adenosine(37)-N6)-threonylcarbamoyltransferase complex ATPase subunit type 1 TsaE [Acidiphilium multivorum]